MQTTAVRQSTLAKRTGVQKHPRRTVKVCSQVSSASAWEDYNEILKTRIASMKRREAFEKVADDAAVQRPPLPMNTLVQSERDQDYTLINDWHAKQWEKLRRVVDDGQGKQ